MQRFAERFALPVATSYRRLPLFDPLHPCYAGDLGIGPNPEACRAHQGCRSWSCWSAGGSANSLRKATACSTFPGRRPSSCMSIPAPRSSGGSIGPIWRSMRAPTPFARSSREHAAARAHSLGATQTQAAHADYLAWTDTPTEQPGGVNLGAVMVWLRENLPDDTILCNGAGNYAAWIHRFYRFRRFATHIAPTSASMGYGMPSAVAMKRLYPERTVISVNGDGDFLMNGQEFATAVQYELPIVVIVCDNGIYGTIRMHQEREYPGRVSATRLRNPDFAAYARAFGGFGVTVEKTRGFRARRSGQPLPPASRRSSTSRSIRTRSRR